MTIKHPLVIIGYGIWFLVLLYIAINLIFINISNMRREKVKNKIDSLFMIGFESFSRDYNPDKLIKETKDDFVFSYICERYSEYVKKEKENVSVEYRQFITSVINKKISERKDNSTKTFCEILRGISLCNISSEEIDNFLNECKKSKEINKSLVSKISKNQLI